MITKKTQKRAIKARRYIMIPNDEEDHGGGRFDKVVVYHSTPQWVCDLINEATDKDGIVDQQRQLFVVKSLDLIKSNKGPEGFSEVDDGELVNWVYNTAGDREHYIDDAKKRLRENNTTYNKYSLFRAARKREQREIYRYVKEQLNEGDD